MLISDAFNYEVGPLAPLVSSQDKEKLERVKTSHLGQVSHFPWAILTLCDWVLYGQHALYKSASPCLTIMVCALVCLHTCFFLHTRPGLTLLQFAPFRTTMWLVCRDWTQTAALVCGIIQPLLPSPALLSPLCLGSWAQDTTHSAAVRDSDACRPCCSFPPLCPAKTCLYLLPHLFQ